MSEKLRLDRRALMVRAMALIGATATVSACDILGVGAAAGPVQLSERQRSVLAAAADTIIPRTETPGAVDVGVPARLEGMLATWASPETGAAFATVLDDIDGLPGNDRAFAELDAEERHALLAAHDASAMTRGDDGELADAAYGRFKDLVVTLYFMSQEALSEELPYVHVPGRWEPSIPVTPELRHSAQLSYFF